ncbi:MAG TPA: GNAT family N-acetyltransferase [Thermodesulfobacteriota bacterium]|nr:GNAT family N-acetyltransferase [Thermodesulfobacteriota bacterium]
MMFEEIWERKGERLESARAEGIEQAYRQKLETELKDGTCRAWVVEDAGEVVASGAVTVVSFVPNPSDLSFKVGYFHSVYTEKSHRNRGCADRILQRAMEYCRQVGARRMILNASAAGRAIYERAGFRAAPEMMRLVMEE